MLLRHLIGPITNAHAAASETEAPDRAIDNGILPAIISEIVRHHGHGTIGADARNTDNSLPLHNVKQHAGLPEGHGTAKRVSPQVMEWMVEPDGIEPTTPCLQSRCSPS